MGTTGSTMFAITTIGTGQSIRPQAVNSTVAVGGGDTGDSNEPAENDA